MARQNKNVYTLQKVFKCNVLKYNDLETAQLFIVKSYTVH